jgi:ATP-binding cassette subfamily B protein
MFEKFISNAQKNLLTRLLKENLRAQLPWYAIAVAAMVLVATMTSASAWIMKFVVNETVISKDINKVFYISILIAVIFTVKGLATYIQTVFLSRAGNNIIAMAQKRVYNHILLQGLNFFSKYNSSDILVRVTNNAQAARNVINLIMTSFVRDLLSLVGLVAVMLIQQPLLSIVSAIVGPAAIFGVRLLTRKVRKIMDAELASTGLIIKGVQETVTGVRVVKAFQLENYMTRRMNKYVEDVERRANAITRLQAATSPIMETLSGFAIAGVLALSGIWVIEKGNTPGELMSFITALLLAYEPAKRLARMRIGLETGLVGVRRMYEILDQPIKLTEEPDAVDLPHGYGEIVFKNVSFWYRKDSSIFEGLNLTFPAGKVTALVGPSGGGKSSIINLIMRLYDPNRGSITINGVDIRKGTFKSLRERMSYVSQDTFLFQGTIRHNIGLGKDGATDEEIEEAAKAAHAHDFIMQFPQGYETDVGENGNSLSGGQKQRIAIARAMLRNADILILDEATSALDSESESLIREAIARLTSGRTTIMIAHRLSTVAFADHIVVMDKGKVAEEGDQPSLLAKDGPYRRLYELQMLPNAEQSQRFEN